MANTDRGYGPLCNHMYMYDLGWLVKTILSFREELDTAIDLKTIHYADPIQWDITTQYSPNTVVVDPKTGTAYMSKVPVPAGVQLDNTDYWVVIFNYQRIYDKIMSGVAFNEKENAEASKDISKYDFVWFGGDLYQAQRDIPQGSKYVPGVNIEATTIADALATYYGRDRVAQVINDTLTVSETQTINTKNRVVNVTGDYHIDVDGATTDNRSGAVTKTYGSSLNAEVTGTYTAEYRDTAIDNADGKRIINAKDIVLNSVNPLTYKKPEGDKKYKYVKFKDLEGNIYNILVAGNNFNYAGDLTLNGNGNFNIATLYDMEYYQSLGALSTKNSEYFRISTYNILPVNYWRYPENKYDKYLDGCISVIETILKSKSNIVGCQEVCGSGLHDFSKYIDFYNKYRYFKYSGKWINGLGNSTLGNSISLDRAASYEATEIDGNRIILKSITTVFNKNCSIYVVHFDTDDETRVKNINSLYNLLLSDLNDIIFIIGDFNCNYNYEPERNELQKITGMGFNISNTTEPTFYNGAIIDYIFYKGVNMVNSEIIKNPFITDDHYLLLADFEEE